MPSRRIIDLILSGSAVLFYSGVVKRELATAPVHIRAILESIPSSHKQVIEISEEIAALSRAYLDAGIVGKASLDDTLHIAAATVGGADAIVSWNFKHIVRLDRIQEYNRVNQEQGYGVLAIISPMEVNFNA